MYKHVRGVALRTVRYSDKASILTAWTAEMGRVSLLMPASASRESRRRRALSMPLSLFEGEVEVRPGRDIMPVRDMRAAVVAPDLLANPVKATIALFLSELLELMLREDGYGDEAFWELLAEAVPVLDAASPAATANFHIHFLYRLAAVMGIEPDMSTYRPGRVFDLAAGLFRDTPPVSGDYVDASEAGVIFALSRMHPRSLALLRLASDERSRALDTILSYFAMHNMRVSPLHSLEVLRAMA